MPSDRLVTLPCGGTILQVHPLEDGVLAVPLFDSQHGLLELPLSGVGGFICLLLLLLSGVVGKQVQLLRRLLLPGAGLIQQPVGADTQAADQQVLMAAA